MQCVPWGYDHSVFNIKDLLAASPLTLVALFMLMVKLGLQFLKQITRSFEGKFQDKTGYEHVSNIRKMSYPSIRLYI